MRCRIGARAGGTAIPAHAGARILPLIDADVERAVDRHVTLKEAFRQARNLHSRLAVDFDLER